MANKRLKLALHWQILLAITLAVPAGLYFPVFEKYIHWMGIVFMSALKMVIIPLILSSIITGVANIGSGKDLGKLGLKTFTYYFSTSLLAILTGLFMVNLFKPGEGLKLGFSQSVEGIVTKGTSLTETLKRMVPSNIFEALSSDNILGIIVFAIVFGYFITKTEKKYSAPVLDFFQGIFEIIMKLTMFIIKLTPYGVFSIVYSKIVQAGDIVEIAAGMATYFGTVVGALAIHAFVTIPIILLIVARVNPLHHFKAMATPFLTAFSTASSNATLPLTMEAMEHKAGVSNKITGFTLPLGATINMDGTALYECIAAIFVAQIYGLELTFIQQATIVFTTLLASIGAAGIPMAGFVMISIILTAVGLPLEGLGLVLAVDAPLDMMRTTVNVLSDSAGCVTVARLEGEEITYKG